MSASTAGRSSPSPKWTNTASGTNATPTQRVPLSPTAGQEVKLYVKVGYKLKINVRPKEKKPVAEFFKPQSRFKHLLRPENKEMLDEIQADVDRKWAKLLKLAGETA